MNSPPVAERNFGMTNGPAEVQIGDINQNVDTQNCQPDWWIA